MKPSIILSPADAASIRNLLDTRESHPGLPPASRAAIDRLLTDSSACGLDEILESHVGLYEPVTLRNPNDSSDWYRMEIVLPADADVDQDRISLAHPMCLAILGRRLDEAVEWDTGHGLRRMRIAEVDKAAFAFA